MEKGSARSAAWRMALAVCVCVVAAGGCESFKETTRGILGTSTKVLEQGRDTALSKSFELDYEKAYHKVKAALAGMGAYVYRDDKAVRMIAVYVSTVDTTPVGIFFTSEDDRHTRVEVSSPSTFAREMLAHRLFNRLAEKDDAVSGSTEKGGVD